MKSTTIAFCLIMFSFALPVAADDAKCVALRAAIFRAGDAAVTIDSATLVPPEAGLPEHCDVRGFLAPEAHFAVKLPSTWNKRFYMVGGGGFAGRLSLPQMNPGLQQGYATATTDTGHDAQKEPLGTFAEHRPDNPHADRKKLDYAHLAVHNTALLAKQLIRAYYGAAPQHSYWVGCSTGGRQGLMEAQRHPEDFDGYLIGAPVLKQSYEGLRGIWNARAVSDGPGAVPYAQLPLVASAVYAKCDAADGAKDGLIADPPACKFNPLEDLPKCAGDEPGKDCFTRAQREGLHKVYDGVRNSKGELLYPGQAPGAEIAVNGRSGWEGSIGGDGGAGVLYGETFMRFLAFDQQRGKTWSWKQFDFDRDPPQMAAFSKVNDATSPDLSVLRKRGGKIIHYHGWADALVNPKMSVNYYESVRRKMGESSTAAFYRLYMIPGMFHCRGGVGCDEADWFSPLVEWVEKGIAPGVVAGARMQQGIAVMSRPHCPYPQVARYRGSGPLEKAESFSCTP